MTALTTHSDTIATAMTADGTLNAIATAGIATTVITTGAGTGTIVAATETTIKGDANRSGAATLALLGAF